MLLRSVWESWPLGRACPRTTRARQPRPDIGNGYLYLPPHYLRGRPFGVINVLVQAVVVGFALFAFFAQIITRTGRPA
jgi:hypothetical protein